MSREHEVRLPDRFWRHSTKISTDAKALYSILLTFIDYNSAETHVGNSRLERESGYGRDKVKDLLVELESNKFIERRRLYVGNLKSKRILRCLKFLSMSGFSVNRLDGSVFGQPKISPISLPSHSHPSPIPKKEESSEPFPADAEKPQRVMRQMTLTQTLQIKERFLRYEDGRALDYCERRWKEEGCPRERWQLINFLEKMLHELKEQGGYPKVLLFRKKQIQRREFAIPKPGETPADGCSCIGGWLLTGTPCLCPKGEPHREQLRKWGMQI